MDFDKIEVVKEEEMNIIIGQSHFIKTVEDVYEAMVTSVPDVRFGIAFCEASGDTLIRYDGTDEKLTDLAVKNAGNINAGHIFVLIMEGAYPINVLPAIKDVQEVCEIYCATANPVEVLIAETDQGRGIMGIIDGSPTSGVESEEDKEWRKDLLQNIGYKR
ncbi:MAG: adenosine-specific kinase [Thermoplasmatota archaeon]